MAVKRFSSKILIVTYAYTAQNSLNYHGASRTPSMP